MSGNTIGGIVGGTIGFLIGGPQGAQIGFTLGSMVGGYVDPVKIKGPRLSDAQNTSSQEGMPIPWGYGTFPCGGNIIWQGDVIEHEKKSGGKGGPQQISYTYTRSYAIGICEGPVTGIQKAWRNGKLVYDISPTSTILGQNSKFLSKFTFYLGDETQNVDPTIEAAEGVGNTGPMRGLCYMVAEDDETSAGEIAQWRFVVQKCGTVSTIVRNIFMASGPAGGPMFTTDGATWAQDADATIGADYLRGSACNGQTIVAAGQSGDIYRSADGGATWANVHTAGVAIPQIAHGNNLFVALSASDTFVSADDGLTWTQHAYSPGGGAYITFGAGKFVSVGTTGLNYSTNGTSWTLGQAFAALGIAFNGANFMAVGNNSDNYSSPDGITWTAGASSPIAGHNSFGCVTGQDGYFLAGAYASVPGYLGIWKTTDLGASWTKVHTSGTYLDAASGSGVDVFGSSRGGGATTVTYSDDAGATWATTVTPAITTNSLIYLGPSTDWYTVPDAPGTYADQDGELITAYITGGTQISACGATLSDIVDDLCDRAGIEAAEVDTSELTDFVKGYVCGTETSAQAFIEPLTKAFFFDRGEWDKKIRFVKRGGANAFALTTDDLVARDGPAIGQTKVQEVELLRKVTVMTIDPAADFNIKPQNWERRIGTIQARGESTEEISIVTDADTAKGIARKRSNVAWSETEKFDYGLTVKWSKLTPTDVGTLTDKRGVVHRVRLTSMNEEAGVFMVEEAAKDRASAYAATATGTVVTTPGTTSPDLVGPTLFAAMALPMLRSSDDTPGFYVGACGVLGGWTGCSILMSVDGGLSYSTALTITEPTTMGTLTAGCTTSSEPIAVRVFGTLESASFLQVGLGKNWAAIASVGGTPEIISYETATSTGTRTYDLTDTYRGRDETVAAAHVSGEQFMDLNTAYFLPIPQAYAGGDILFKAVGFGVSPDAVDPVTVPFAGTTYIIDGGGP